MQPSIQKLVGSLASDCLIHLTEEAVHTDAFNEDVPGVRDALTALKSEFSPSTVDKAALLETLKKAPIRGAKRRDRYQQTVCSVYCSVKATIHTFLRSLQSLPLR